MRFTRRSAAWTTPSLIAPVLQTSQNWFAEQLKTIGREAGGEGSWSRGLELERRFLIDVVGIDGTAFRLRGRVTARTGSINNVDSLSGFRTADSGRRVTFAIIANNSGRSSTAMRPVPDDIVRAISAGW